RPGRFFCTPGKLFCQPTDGKFRHAAKAVTKLADVVPYFNQGATTMVQDFIPSNDDAFLAWVTPFSAKITATPTAYGVTAGIATTLATKKTTFATTLAAAQDPQTRGKSTILAKETARNDLEAYCRQTARQIQGTLT